MAKYLISIIIILTSHLSIGQDTTTYNYSFISELQFATPTSLNQNKITKEISHVPINYIKEHKVKLIGKTKNIFTKTLVYLNVELISKEDYWNADEYHWTEVRITVPKNLHSKIYLNIDIARIDPIDSTEKELLTPSSKIDISIPDVSPTRYINQNTFKTKDAIYIDAPEDLSVDIIVDYLQKALDSTISDIPQFQSTIRYLNRYQPIDKLFGSVNILELRTIINNMTISFDKFKEFNSLLLFLEPYIADSSFLNREARKLSYSIQDISLNLKNLDSTTKKQLLKYETTYGNYKTLKQRIENYYSYLKLTLYDERNYAFLSQGMPPTKVAIIFGVDNYKNFTRLKNGISDAISMQTALTKMGYSVILETDPTNDLMIYYSNSWLDRLPNKGTCIFYFSGVGFQEINGYKLLPIDGDTSTFSLKHSFNLNLFISQLSRKSDSLTKIVLIDATRQKLFSTMAESSIRNSVNTIDKYVLSPGIIGLSTISVDVNKKQTGIGRGLFNSAFSGLANSSYGTVGQFVKNLQVLLSGQDETIQSQVFNINLLTNLFYFSH